MAPKVGIRPMRIIALPLARVRTSPDARLNLSNYNLNSLLIFYHFDLISPCAERNELPWHKKLLKNATNKAASLWSSLGKAPQGSWKLWSYTLGERMADKIEFEELALRNVDASLRDGIKQVDSHKNDTLPKISLFYPPSLYPTGAEHALHTPLVHLQTLLANRAPRHRRGFYLWMLTTPLTIPITLIPIIPNLPLFFCVWRSWSHYRAYRSSQYLSSLLDRGLIEPNPSLELDKLYGSLRMSRSLPLPVFESRSPTPGGVTADRTSESPSGTGSSSSGCMLLTREEIPRILEMFRLPESTAIDMSRAINQAHARLAKSPLV